MTKILHGERLEKAVWDKAALSGRQLLVLIVIAKGADAEGGRWSGYIFNQLAVPARASRIEIENDLRRLKACGFIKIERSDEFAHIWICDPDHWIKGEQAR